MKAFFFSIVLLLSLFLAPPALAQSQTCGGSINCCTQEGTVCSPAGCNPLVNPNCSCGNQCIERTTRQCRWFQSIFCEADFNVGTQCIPGYSSSGSCTTSPSCPSGQIFCGGCVNGCRSNTQTCAQWIDQCDGGGNGGGGGGGWGGCGSCSSCGGPANECVQDPQGGCQWDPGLCAQGPPSCSPNCTPNCGQNDGCGNTCPSTALGAPAVPVISNPTQGSTAQTNTSNDVAINFNSVALADSYQLQYWPTYSPAGVDITSTGQAISSAGTNSQNSRGFAFDSSNTSNWASQETGSAVNGVSWIGQDFGDNPDYYRQVRRIRIRQIANVGRRMSSVRVQFSDDLNTWTDVGTYALPIGAAINTIDLPETNTHRAWRILANAGVSSSTWPVADIDMELGGVATPAQTGTTTTTSFQMPAGEREYSIRIRALNSSCSTQYGNWSPIRSFYVSALISGAVYLDSNSTAQLSGGLCTGPTTPINQASTDVATSAQSISSGDANTTTGNKNRAFDNNNTTYWASSQQGANVINSSIGQNFGVGNEKHIRRFNLRQYSAAGYRVNSVRVQYSDNGTNWTTHQTVPVVADGNLRTYYIDSSGPHRYWRLLSNQALTGSYRWAVNELEMMELSGTDTSTLSISGQDWQNVSEVGTIDQSGSYTIHLPHSQTGTNTVSLLISNGQFVCSCPIGCVYGGLNAPLSGVNFYVTDAQDPWFQVAGGSILAYESNGTAIRNPISTQCTEQGGCNPYMITQSGGANTSGFVVTGGGDVDLRAESGVQNDNIDQDGRNRSAVVENRSAQERYEYFTRLYRMPAVPQSDFGAGAGQAQKPTGTPVNAGVEGYFHNGDMTISDAWTVNSGESIVIFVDGDLNINNTILVAQGGFLSFFVSGDIIISPNVGHTDATISTPVVEGVYVANGQIRFPSVGTAGGGDRKFVGAGTFVGWSGILMERDYDNGGARRLLNNTNPTEYFLYRPDFLINTPEQMKAPRYQWREVTP